MEGRWFWKPSVLDDPRCQPTSRRCFGAVDDRPADPIATAPTLRKADHPPSSNQPASQLVVVDWVKSSKRGHESGDFSAAKRRCVAGDT